MRQHDVEGDGSAEAASHKGDHHETPPSREVGHGVEAGRPDALGPGGLLHLQQAVGNRSVRALVAQRRTSGDEAGGTENDGESPVGAVVSTQGSPLDPTVRSAMETTLGHDFSDVQVHTDPSAAASARSVQAHAYTVGNHVVFGEGGYQPETSEGRRTLAHELTHVVQQRQGPVDGTPAAGGIRLSDPSDRFEREAEAVADRVVTAPAPAPDPAAPSTGPAVQLQAASSAGIESAPVQRQAAEEEEEEEEAPPEAAETTEPASAETATAAQEAPAPEAVEEAEQATPSEGVPEVEEENEEESLTKD